ncbi:hypothetical protein IAU60_003180 [Kwoniella sp. DSM 27419]
MGRFIADSSSPDAPPASPPITSRGNSFAAMRYSWYAIAGVVLALGLMQLWRRRRPRGRRWTALGAAFRNVMYLRSFPWWLYGPETYADAVFTSFSQLPIILLLVSKNNPVSSLTGVTYQKLNYVHRASSRGIAALTGFTLLWATSFRVVRRVAYEFFLVSHVVFSLLRRGVTRIELLDHDVMRVAIRRKGFKWKAGQHGTTLEADVTTTIPLGLEGPYGHAHSLDHFDTVLLVAGGTGVTFVLSHFLQIIANAPKPTSRVTHLHLVWHVRHAEDVEWVAPLLNQAYDEVDHLDVRVDVYVTKSHASDEPWEESTADGCRTCGPGTPISRDAQVLLPKPSTVMRYGLTGETAALVRWRRGRADLETIVREDAEGFCGPVQLLHATKHAVRAVSTLSSSLQGPPSIDFFEETLGA